MRERVRKLRGRGRAVVLGRWVPITPYLLCGVLMAHVGAFHTDGYPLGLRYAYFIGLTAAGGIAAAWLHAVLREQGLLATRPAARLAVEIGGLLTPMVWVAAAWLLDGDPAPGRMIDLAGQVMPVAALLVPLGRLVQPRDDVPLALGSPNAAPSAALRDVLPPALRSAAIHAVEAQDHYLRVHTDAGAALVMLRLADALAQLADMDGARTHRSWWVARAAVVDARRGRGRAVLTLRNGLTAPVSRTYAPALRRAGWF